MSRMFCGRKARTLICTLCERMAAAECVWRAARTAPISNRAQKHKSSMKTSSRRMMPGRPRNVPIFLLVR